LTAEGSGWLRSESVCLQTDVVGVREEVGHMVDRVTTFASTSVGEYGPVSVLSPTMDVEVSAVSVSVEESCGGSVEFASVMRKESVGIQAGLDGMSVVESGEHVFMERVSDLSEAGVASLLLSQSGSHVESVRGPADGALRMTDVCVSYAYPSEEVSSVLTEPLVPLRSSVSVAPLVETFAMGLARGVPVSEEQKTEDI
jgi:hypothetical protein